MEDGDFDLDWGERFEGLSEEWEVIERVLPPGWQEAARETGALRRTRGFRDAAALLRVLLIHLVEGCSLRETAVRADAGGLAHVSDVALLGRLRGCGEWFRWMVEQMSRRLSTTTQEVLAGKRVRLVDATVVCEPGATGSTWRIHYMIDLSTLACEQLQVTLPDEGETLTRFEVQNNDVLMADRGLAHRRGIRHVVDHGGDVIVRSNMISVPLEDDKGRQVALLPRLRKLAVGQARDWPALVRDDQGTIPVRVCALKKLCRGADDTARRIGAADPGAVPTPLADRVGLQAAEIAPAARPPEEDRSGGSQSVATRQAIRRHADRNPDRRRRAFFPLGVLLARRAPSGGVAGVKSP
jgi:hypothetical protein